MTQKPFCLYPWYHQRVRTSGNTSPCCAFVDLSMPDIHHNDYFNSSWIHEFRNNMLQHKIHPGCNTCLTYEEAGGWSNREESFYYDNGNELKEYDFESLIQNPVLSSQEVDFSNICDLKCRMCDSDRSTKWIIDDAALKRHKNGLKKSNWVLANPESVTSLRFLGGEPLMHQTEIINELEKISSLNRLQEVKLHFNSNMMTALRPELLDLFSKCKYVSFNCSLDGVGKLNDYIRSDSVWDIIVKNIKELIYLSDSHLHNLACIPINTVSVFNANKFSELYEWQLEVFTEKNIPTPPILVCDPSEFSVINLPTSIKLKLSQVYDNELKKQNLLKNHWLSMFNNLKIERVIPVETFLQKFHETNGILDKRRFSNFKDANPEMAKWLHDEMELLKI